MQPTLVVIAVPLVDTEAAAPERSAPWQSGEARARWLQRLAAEESVDEVAVISAGERTGFILWTADAGQAANSVLRHLVREDGLTQAEWSRSERLLDGAALARVVELARNEPAALVKAYAEALRSRCSGFALETIFTAVLNMVCEAGSSESGAGWSRQQFSALRARLAADGKSASVSAVREQLERLCREELERLGEEFGPFTRDQQSVLARLAANIARRLGGTLQRRFARPEGGEETLLKLLGELFAGEIKISPEPEKRSAAQG